MKRTTRRIIKSKQTAAELEQRKQVRNKRIKQVLLAAGALVALRFAWPYLLTSAAAAVLPVEDAATA